MSVVARAAVYAALLLLALSGSAWAAKGTVINEKRQPLVDARVCYFVDGIELLCTLGLPAIYTQILTLQELPRWQNYAYLGLYNVAYMFDDSLMVAVVVISLGRRKLQEEQGRWLKLLSGLVVAVLGIVLLFWPEWLQAF